MKLFISWSGLLSKKIAIEIEQWLKRFFTMDFETFISDNIDAGRAWDFEILSHLKQSQIGLLILTKENFK